MNLVTQEKSIGTHRFKTFCILKYYVPCCFRHRRDNHDKAWSKLYILNNIFILYILPQGIYCHVLVTRRGV
jgi:hypothetical protein